MDNTKPMSIDEYIAFLNHYLDPFVSGHVVSAKKYMERVEAQ